RRRRRVKQSARDRLAFPRASSKPVPEALPLPTGLLVAEKPGDLVTGSLGAVGGVNHIVGILQRKVAANGSRGRLERIRSSDQVADVSDGARAFEDAEDHVTSRDRLDKPWKKGLVRVVTIVHPGDVGLDGFHGKPADL